jgi:hypothetical protein
MSRIKVTIDRLVLTGLDPAHRSALLEALQSELSNVLADRTTAPCRRSRAARPCCGSGGCRSIPARLAGGSSAGE